MPKTKNETPKTNGNEGTADELVLKTTAKKSAKETATKKRKDPVKNIEAEQIVSMDTAIENVQTQADDFSDKEIAPKTEDAINATIVVSQENIAELNSNERETLDVEMTIDEKIDLPQIGVKIPPNDEIILLSPKSEVILEVALTELHPPEFYPFQINHDEAMDRLAESIKEYGVYEPGVARPKIDENGNFDGYELLIGNRRKMACGLAGLNTMPIIIRELDDDSAVITMVDSNLEQREKILYSEKAWAYKIKMEALNHKGIKNKTGKTSAEIITEQTGDSRNHIFRLIRLTELVVGLLDKVDEEQLSFHSAVELSYLSPNEQFTVISAMEANDMKPSVSQAVKLKNLKQSGELTDELIYSILAEEKTKGSPAETKVQPYRKYFPADYTPKQITKVISDLLEVWQKENLSANEAQSETKSDEQGADVTNASSDSISSEQATTDEGGAVNA